MATCIPFQSQLSSIMEVLLKAAVAEISKLVDDKCAVLHLEISRKQTENELLRRKLLLLESKTAQLQRGVENYMDRGGGGAGSSCPPTATVKFPEIDDAAVSFTIKEESPDEALWIRDSSGPIGSAVQYHNAAGAPENRQFEVDQQATHSEATRRKISEFGASYTSGPHAVDIGGLQFTVKTEKEEERPAFRPDGCQHGGGKQPQLAVEFSLDERDTQLWSAIIEGNDIDAGFPDFSSVVDEYSDTFPDHSETSGRAASVQPPAGQRLCNGIYGSDVAQSSAFLARPPADKQKEQVYLRNTSQGAHLRPADPEREAGEKPGGPQSHNAFSPGSFPPPHRPLSGTARGFACSHCGKSFSRLHQFKLHQQSHKRKRAFWCAVCGKSFQCSSHLSIHHRTHTGEKPYGCAQCGKRFTQQSSLRVHQRTHSGERPYSCSQCGKTFILMHHLKRHRIIHTYS